MLEGSSFLGDNKIFSCYEFLAIFANILSPILNFLKAPMNIKLRKQFKNVRWQDSKRILCYYQITVSDSKQIIARAAKEKVRISTTKFHNHIFCEFSHKA